MKSVSNYPFFLLIFLFSLAANSSTAESYCQNLGFELRNFTNWRAFTWAEGQPGYTVSTPKVEGVVQGRHTIITANGYDPIVGGNKLKLIPDGYSTSVKLGSTYLGSGGLRQSLSYTLDVTKQNSLIIYHFAVVLQDPYDASHKKEDEPRFNVTILSQKGDTIDDCANYDVFASDAKIEGWNTIQYGGKPLYWRDWTAVGINLTNYIGQTVTIEFMTANCRRKGHFGYAYLTAECQSMQIGVGYCAADVNATLTAPNGFLKYKWLEDGKTIGTTQSITVQNAVEGKTFQCEMTSETATTCMVTLDAVIKRYEPKADFKYTYDCHTNTVSFSNLSTTNDGTLQYEWDFGDGTKSTDVNPVHRYTSVGKKTISLKTKTLPSTCVDVVQQVVETFVMDSVKISGSPLICRGEKTTLKALGASKYEWSTGEKTESIEVNASGSYWVIGYSADGSCNSGKKYFNLDYFPDWNLEIQGDVAFCEGKSTVLTAVGAVKQIWNTGETTKSITVSKPGTYSVTGTNQYGCTQNKSVTVTELAAPRIKFALSSSTVDIRNNTLTGSVEPEPNTVYTWDMGDGLTETGETIQHAYKEISSTTYGYQITVSAVNSAGCSGLASQTIDVLLFVPNIFTPNGDDVNDVFMKGYDILIIDRNGMEIYKGTDGWDGTYKGKTADVDTYFYIVKYVDKNQQPLTKKGYVMLKK